MKTTVKICLSILTMSMILVGCDTKGPSQRAVFFLIDTSGTYTEELNKAQSIMNYLLATLDSGDSIAMARIDSGSFSEKDIIAKTTFDTRPSTANDQKRLFKHQIDQFVDSLARGSANTDITGGILQAAEYVNETQAEEKYILIFSDLEEDLKVGHIRDFPIELKGINVVALNVTKLRSDNIDPRDYQNRLNHWQGRVTQGGGEWRVLNDLERLDKLIKTR
ncbi:VWA domain-containing protein [Pleionea litopenaei]|uniref:VWA domain-containing protein n=1 Tax=Pleionea litopenaei TaxID=3070815 RepID=A0AA51RT21_9GAMM|nr:VWA domain-containing protein [Pleionea sp. HL-JVS1]WMS87138.1 VWA domain-containing protein [Pleionea sp. HL-JVS1]